MTLLPLFAICLFLYILESWILFSHECFSAAHAGLRELQLRFLLASCLAGACPAALAAALAAGCRALARPSNALAKAAPKGTEIGLLGKLKSSLPNISSKLYKLTF